jgi:hypothetical protein
MNRVYELPTELRRLFSALIIGLAERVRTEQRYRGELSQIGPDRLMAYLKAQRRNNWAQRDPELGKAVKAVYALNEPSQAALVDKMYEPVCLVGLYCDVCRQIGMRESPDDVRAIIETGFVHGGEEAEALLRSIFGPSIRIQAS